MQTVVNYNSFMTSEILPWKYQENPNIAWDSIKFDKTLVDLEPEQGVPRYVTVEREGHTDYMVRRGLALIVNHGFAGGALQPHSRKLKLLLPQPPPEDRRISCIRWPPSQVPCRRPVIKQGSLPFSAPRTSTAATSLISECALPMLVPD